MLPTDKRKPQQAYSQQVARKSAPGEKSAAPSLPRGGTFRQDLSERGEAPLSPHERQQLIAKAAYFRAQQRGFISEGELDDWLQAEAEVDRFLLGRQPGGSAPSRNRRGSR